MNLDLLGQEVKRDPSPSFGDMVIKLTSPSIFFDMDGVLCNFMASVGAWFEVDREQVKLATYDISEALGIPLSRIDAVAKMDEEFWTSMIPNFTVVEAFKRLNSKYRVFVLTKPWDDSPVCLSGKFKWCQKFLGLKSSQFLPMKVKSLVAYPGRVLIDDSLIEIQQWTMFGGAGVVHPALHNAHHWPYPFLQIYFKDPDFATEVIELECLDPDRKAKMLGTSHAKKQK